MDRRSEHCRGMRGPHHARTRRVRRAVVAVVVLMMVLVVLVSRLDDGDEPAPEGAAPLPEQVAQVPMPPPERELEGLQAERLRQLPDGDEVKTVVAEDPAAAGPEAEAASEEMAASDAAAPAGREQAPAGRRTRLRLGGFGELEAARERRQTLARADFPAQLFHRVAVGPYDTRGEAERALRQLRDRHEVAGVLIGGPSAGGRWSVQVGVFAEQDNAERLRERLAGHGYPVELAGRLELGPYASRAEAERAVVRLESDHGIDAGAVELRDAP